MERLIRDAGFEPKRRDTRYRKVETSIVHPPQSEIALS